MIAILSKPVLPSSPIIGLTVGVGIILAVDMAAIIGSTAPIIFIEMKVDPAISTGPFITVTNDIIGLAIYLATTSFIYSFI